MVVKGEDKIFDSTTLPTQSPRDDPDPMTRRVTPSSERKSRDSWWKTFDVCNRLYPDRRPPTPGPYVSKKRTESLTKGLLCP